MIILTRVRKNQPNRGLRRGLRRVLFTAVSLVLLLSWGLPAQAPAPSRVAILPFTANSQEDISFLVNGIRDMLASRLAWQDKVTVIEQDLITPVLSKISPPYNDAAARRIGKELSANVVVFGSITSLGKSISVDARVVKTDDDSAALSSFMQAENMDLVIPRITDFAQKINAEIFVRPEAVAARQQDSGSAQNAEQSEPDARNMTAEGMNNEQVSPLNPLFLRSLSGVESDRYWRSPRIAAAVQSVAVDDIDSDGKNELIVLLEDSVRIYRLAGEYFALTNEFKNGPKGQYMFADVADLRGTGKPQIFVTNLYNQSLRSFILEWTDGNLKMVADSLPYYLRIQPAPLGKGKILLGQKNAVDTPFNGPVWIMKPALNNSWEPGEVVPVPRYGGNITTVALADLNGSGKPLTVMVGMDFTLRVFASITDELWRSGDMYGGTNKFIEYMPREGSGTDTAWWWLPARILPVDLDNSGRPQIVIVRNLDHTSGVFEKMRMFYQGIIYGLHWNGLSMVEQWRTPNIHGHIPDYTVADVGNVGRPALVMAVGQRVLQGLMDRETSHIVAFTLKVQDAPAPNKGL